MMPGAEAAAMVNGYTSMLDINSPEGKENTEGLYSEKQAEVTSVMDALSQNWLRTGH